MSAHARLGASNAHRWLACPGSVAAESSLPRGKSSSFAEEGSAAHELAELCLVNGTSPYDYENTALPEHSAITVNREMCDAIQQYIDYVKALPGEQEYEQRVSYSDWVPGGFDVVDVISICAKTKTIIVCDLKYGKGIRVDAEHNPQLMLYALGAYAENSLIHDLESVRMSVVQPRLDHISEWTISVDDLLKFGAWVSEQAELALSDDAPRAPGEKQCQWCAVKATCPALATYTRKIIGAEFDDLRDPSQIEQESLREALGAKKLIVAWLDAIETHVTDLLVSGQGFEGYKLVAGRSLRQWGDVETAETSLGELLGEQAYVKKLISPAQAEKLIAKSDKPALAELIVKPDGKPALAPESDKRPAINITIDDFNALQ